MLGERQVAWVGSGGAAARRDVRHGAHDGRLVEQGASPRVACRVLCGTSALLDVFHGAAHHHERVHRRQRRVGTVGALHLPASSGGAPRGMESGRRGGVEAVGEETARRGGAARAHDGVARSWLAAPLLRSRLFRRRPTRGALVAAKEALEHAAHRSVEAAVGERGRGVHGHVEHVPMRLAEQRVLEDVLLRRRQLARAHDGSGENTSQRPASEREIGPKLTASSWRYASAAAAEAPPGREREQRVAKAGSLR